MLVIYNSQEKENCEVHVINTLLYNYRLNVLSKRPVLQYCISFWRPLNVLII